MKRWRFFNSVYLWLALITGCLSAVAIQPGWADVKPSNEKSKSALTSKIRHLIEHPIASAQQLVQSPAPPNTPSAEVVQVTQVKVNRTALGVEVILQTTKGQQLQVTNRSTGNSFIADIPNAQLHLQSGEAFTFRSEKPLAGITEITVTNFDANTIRVTVIGEASSPTVELFDSDEGLIFGLTTAASTAQQPPQTQPTPEQQQPANQTQPQQPSASSDQPIELVVTGEQDGYRVPNASVGTRTDTPLRDIPQSIEVVPQEVLRDQNVTYLEDALKNVTGVTPVSSPVGFGDGSQFTIRGFQTTNRSGGSFLRNGFREGGDIPSEIPNIEKIEVLKGPASVLYGNANPGGTINLVTKQPLRDPFYAIDATIGNYDFYQGTIDLSGPLNDSRTVLYRLNVSYLNTGSFIDFFERSNFSIAPIVSFAIGKRTRLILESDYTERSTVGYLGLPALGTVLLNPNGRIPRNRLTGEPDGVVDNSIFRVGYRLEHQFSDNWSLQNAFRARIQKNKPGNEFYIVNAFNNSLDSSDNRTLNRNAIINTVDNDDYDLAINLTGKFSTGSIDHQLVFGVDLSRSFLGYEQFSTPAPLDLFNPVYRRPFAEPFTFAFDGEQLTNALGIYIQDQVTLAPNLKLLLGGRFDLFEQSNRFLSDTTSQSGDGFSPRVGIVYQPIEPISLYASYSRSFFPNSGTAFDGSVFEPERGTQYEVGVKADLNERLSATLAFYHLTRSNIVTDDPLHSGFGILTGEQRSQGVEFSIGGEIQPGWNIIAGYAYTDAQITEDNILPVGNRLANVPENAFNLWTTYEIQRGSLQGFGVGVGFFFVGERQGDLDNSFQLPSYLRTDASIFYKRDRFRAAINVRNLFNVDYFESTTGPLSVYPGAPFTVVGSVSVEF
ncbi:MAG: TonB-dependent siderophore receptor [Nostoc sp.]|uniref:TonB-dependent siderophore receptor n=1 Tax=Nostoc sp. TaxID=1180 RepID=UPI002FF8872D